MQDYFWVIKNLENVCDESNKNDFSQEKIISMLANNFLIIYIKIFEKLNTN